MRKAHFTLALLMLCAAPARADQVVFSEIMYHPAAIRPEFIEIHNMSMTPLDMARWSFTDGVDYTFPDFAGGTSQAHILRPQERIVISAADEAATRAAYPSIPAGVRVFGQWTGALANSGETLTLSDKNGVVVCTVDYKDGGRWPRAADGAGHSLVLVNENRKLDDYRNWSASRFTGGTPGYPSAVDQAPVANPEVGAGTAVPVVEYDDVWRYTTPAGNPGTSWRDLAFDDSSWNSGPGLLGFETAGLPAPGLQTPFGASGPITYLFRREFTFNGNPSGATAVIDQIVDDGAAYYLNGQLLGSVGVDTGGAWDQDATRTVSDAAEELGAVVSAANGLVNGLNVLSAEVHQANSGSSDMVFGARMTINTQPDLVINEVKPGLAGQGFVEFFNTSGAPIDLQNHYLSDNEENPTQFRILESLVVAPGGFATVGFAESSLAVTGGITSVFLTQPDGITALNAIQTVIPPDGRSLGRNADGGTDWFLFAAPTPASPNGTGGGGSVRLNEVHFSGGGNVDWVELQNLSMSARSGVGLFLASTPELTDKVPLSGVIPGGGYASWPVDFATDSAGDVTIYLVDSGDNVLATAELERNPARPSMQAVHPVAVPTMPAWETINSQAEWFSSASDTGDAANSISPTTAIVINEIMADPPSGQANGEFVELHNTSGAEVSLEGWKIRGGIDFDFPAGATIPAGGYLVVAASSDFFQNAYPGVGHVGDWSGKLGNRGDLIRLVDADGNLADEVDYRIGGDWPTLANGSGSSLELIHPSLDNNRASAWRASDESNKTAFQTYTISGVWSQLNTYGSPSDYKELHLFAVGDSHLVLRNITLRQNGTGPNLIPNSNTHATNGSGASGWLCQGTHWASYVDAGELHLIADGHGDNRPNRAEIDATGMVAGNSYTIQFEARWISGKNRLIVQTWDHSLGGSLLLPMPENPGTAGTPNSALAAAAPPQVDSALHSPAVPKSSDPVRITARISSPVPLISVEVFHRLDEEDNSFDWVAAPMFDNGENGDEVANDGLYTALVTDHQVNERIVQFYVRATASNGATSVHPRGGPDLPGIWIVDNRNIGGALRSQRFVISQYDRDALNESSGLSTKFQYDFPRLSNHYFNATFIHNESDVYYNAELRKSGSPWTRDSGNTLTRGKWKLPRDRAFRGREKSTFDNDPDGGSRHHNRLTRYWLYVLGHPVNENEYIYNVVNGGSVAVREDTEPVDGGLVDRNFPEGDGQLMRSDDEWWFTDDWNQTSRNADWSYKGTDAAIRYHTEWMLRSREAEYDYSSLIGFFKTVSNPGSSEAQLNQLIDPELTLMMAAVRGYIQDWDSLTLERGKNGFFYRKPSDGRWMFLHWDSDLAFGDPNGSVVGGLAGWGTYINKPWTRRIFNHYLTAMLELTSGSGGGRTLAWLDAEEAASSAYSVSRSTYTNWFASRRPRIEQEINLGAAGGPSNSYTAPFAITTSGGTTAAATLGLAGTAPSSVHAVSVDGHPEGVLSWSNQQAWQINGLVLASGVNNFTVRATDFLGNTIATLPFNITKTGNGPPVMNLVASPASLNVALGQELLLDGTGSFDPEGGILSFGWNHTPASGIAVTHPTPATTNAVFNAPGIYNFTLTGTDTAPSQSSLTREIAAFNPMDFSSFSDDSISPHWTFSNLEARGSFSPGTWHSTEDKPGQLLVQLLDSSARPLAFNSPTFPSMLRPLPAATDWALQTDLALDAGQIGTYQTGLFITTTESGAPAQYAFCLENGTSLSLKRSTGGAFNSVGFGSFINNTAVLRVRRIGDQLLFQQRTADVWTTVATQVLPPGSTVQQGGIFAATSIPQNVRIAFDYVMLVDPGNASSVINNLRITEVMYHPADPDTVEFIELRNFGAESINLEGVRFTATSPFDEFAFGDIELAPGQFAVVTNDTAAFLAKYGAGALLAGQWTGALSNGGETIALLDSGGATIHNFDYSDDPPWPLAADGGGPSLEVIDVTGDYSDGLNWRAGDIGGSPGTLGIGPDTDGDGQPDSWEALFGTDPNDPASRYRVTIGNDSGGQPVVSWPSVPGVSYRIEYSEQLTPDSWLPLGTVTGVGSYTDTTTPLPSWRFYRVAPLQ